MTTSIQDRVERVERLLALALHTFDGPTTPDEASEYRMLLHELRTDVARNNNTPNIPKAG